jgi:hypothetical protein
MFVLVQPLLGTRDFDHMWDTLWTILILILILVFVHGALRVRKDMEFSGGSMRRQPTKRPRAGD